MVGVLNRVISYDLQENDNKNPVKMINPEIIWTNDEKQTFEEGSICFPSVTLKIERPKQIKVKYLDIESRLGNKDFARVHRSTIVKRALIESIKPLSIGDKKIHLQGGVDVRVSRRFHENLKLVG